MVLRKIFGAVVVVGVGLSALLPSALAQDEKSRHGRKYKAPPVTSHIEVTVVKAFNGKPIQNAAVIFRPIKDGKDEGNLEVKTDPEGKAIIDVISTGSEVRVQVIANGYATFGEDYLVDTATKEIAVSMVRPQAQVSAYTGKTEERKVGVQEPAKPKRLGVPPAGSTAPATPPVSPARPESAPATVPGATSPPSL